jgi:hypothetical protein
MEYLDSLSIGFAERVWLEWFKRKNGCVPTRLWVDPKHYQQLVRDALRMRPAPLGYYALPEPFPEPGSFLSCAGIPIFPR